MEGVVEKKDVLQIVGEKKDSLVCRCICWGDADSEIPVETLTFSASELAEETEKPVKFVKFQNVNSLSLFIETNQQDSDVTVINRLTLIGSVMPSTKINELKKIGDDH